MNNMNGKARSGNGVWLAVAALVAVAAVAWMTHLWLLTVIPIGFLFGFFPQKGNLLGTSAFSEVILKKDWRNAGAA